MVKMSIPSVAETIRDKVMETASKGKLGRVLQKSIDNSLEFSISTSNKSERGESMQTLHELHEMNDFYICMANNIKSLQLDGNSNYDDEDDGTSVSSVVSVMREHRDCPDIRKQIDLILKLEDDIQMSMKELKAHEAERKELEEDVCNILESQDINDENTKQFLHLIKTNKMEGKEVSNFKVNGKKMRKNSVIDTSNPDIEMEQNEQNDDDVNSQTVKQEKNFIKRNIETVKNATMNTPMTDEEKIYLEKLLSSIDVEDDKEIDDAFKLDDSQISLLDEIDANIKETSEYSQQLQKYFENNNDIEDSKSWQLEDRLKAIDNALEQLRQKDDIDKSDVNPNLLQTLSEVETDERDLVQRILTESHEAELKNKQEKTNSEVWINSLDEVGIYSDSDEDKD